MKSFWKNKKIVVTGGTGFIGSHVVEMLVQEGGIVTVPTSTRKLDNLSSVRKDISITTADLTSLESAKRVFRGKDIILHLAAVVAGIELNRLHPVKMFNENILLNQTVLHASALSHIERLLVTSSACVYPRVCSQPIREASGFIDSPEPTNRGYGWAKRFSEIAASLYTEEYGMKIAIARPFNAYGPRDHFNPAISHVIPGIIKRVFDGENPLAVWGSGKQTRSFIYVSDLAQGLINTCEKYAVADPVNIGSSEEVTMKDLAQYIISASGEKIPIVFDTTKPDGQPRRLCDTSKAAQKFGFHATTTLSDGLKKTIEWYRQHSSS
jgi:GDP-L-fucose synthase